MVDIIHKRNSLRSAIAQAVVKTSSVDTINAIKKNTVPKGNVLETARVAALFAAKKTAEMIPDCHPLPVEQTSVSFEVSDLDITISVQVKTVYKTGVEVEAMHAASVAALTIYDMLKPIDKGIEINNIKLLEKKGGKSGFNDKFEKLVATSVIVASDSVHAGTKEDTAGKMIIEGLRKYKDVSVNEYIVVPDDQDVISNKTNALSSTNDLIIVCGGTGLSPRDNTPEAIKQIIDKEIPGIMEAARSYGQQRTAYAMLSRGIAGLKGRCLIITFPGSTRGAKETMDALFPEILHIFKVLEKGYRHHNQVTNEK